MPDTIRVGDHYPEIPSAAGQRVAKNEPTLHPAPEFDVERLYALEETKASAIGACSSISARSRHATARHRELAAAFAQSQIDAKYNRVRTFPEPPSAAEVERAREHAESLAAEDARQADLLREPAALADRCRQFLVDAGYPVRPEIRA